ncbi:transglutaminase [Rhodobacteraceae bacterium CH30]|uniref:Transglutaminase n=1 Tax=Craterilacuibacter sinensis TaxID=2686017 RepID=A0A845BUP8_9NEIS|nr:transglutaminase [Craterilacuibacter sinensis]RQW25862.1 transglutaminase [Rhodobacteraceae bacterium CH30]
MKRLHSPIRRYLRLHAVVWLLLAASTASLELPAEQAARQYGGQSLVLYRDWTSMLAPLGQTDEMGKLKAVNQFINRRIRFADDFAIWQQSDYWASPLEMFAKGAGDCEDFAIAKYISLRSSGIEAAKLRLTYVKARIGGPDSNVSQAHMVLAYYPSPSAEPLVLDNLVTSILPASQRNDLTPVFSFNTEALWAGNTRSSVDRLTRWRQVMERMRKDGFVF